MRQSSSIFLFPLLALSSMIVAVGCGGGGGSSGPGTNACEDIGLSPKIIDGTACGGKSPVVKLFTSITSTGYSSCSGTAISSRKVLTAAHCVIFSDKKPIQVVPNNGYYASTGGIDQILARSVKITAHPDFVADDEALSPAALGVPATDPNLVNLQAEAIFRSGYADIAVIEFDRDLQLPTLPIRIGDSLDKGEIISIYGYGQLTGDGADTFDLYSGKMEIDRVGPENIGSIFQSGGSDTCNGDSGGPAVSGIPAAIVGVTSLGTTNNCKKNELSIFTGVSGPRVRVFLQQVAPDASLR